MRFEDVDVVCLKSFASVYAAKSDATGPSLSLLCTGWWKIFKYALDSAFMSLMVSL